MFSSFPIEAILIYLAILFAPLDMDRIVIDVPSESGRRELVRNGQTWRFDGDVVQIDGDSLVIFGAEGRETLKISEFVALPGKHDWVASPAFALGGGHTLRKTATGFICLASSADDKHGETTHIHYQKMARPGGEISVNLLGKVAQPGVFRLPAKHTLRDAIAAAGGPASGADTGRVSIIRGAAGSVPLVTSIDLTAEDAFNPMILSGDTIHVAAAEARSIITDMAMAWLAIVDAGDYEQSWKDAAEFLRQSITEEGWADMMMKFRKPLDAMKSRILVKVDNTETLPGVPDGEYVVMQFDTSFETKETAVEIVTFMKQSDGVWKAAGYVIR